MLFRRRAKHAAIFLCGFALLLALAYALFMWHSNRRVQREMEAIRALGEPTNWDELQRIGPDGKVGAPLPDSQEASRLFTEAVTDAEGPLLELLERSLKDKVPVTWGV